MSFLKQQTQAFITASAAVRAYASRSGAPRLTTFEKLQEGAALSEKIPVVPGILTVLRRMNGNSSLTQDQLQEKYNALSKEEKKPIWDARQKVREQKKTFIAGLSTKQLENVVKYKEAKESGTYVEHRLKNLVSALPKTATSAWNFFVKDACGNRESGTKVDLKVLVDQFNALDGQSKQKYQALAEAAQAAQPAKFQAWKESLSADELKLLKSNAGKSLLGPGNYRKIFGKRPPNELNLFVKEYFAKHHSAGGSTPETFKAAIAAFNQLDAAEKAKYKSA